MEEYSLPPGYVYELMPSDDESWFGIVDRAGEEVIAIPLSDFGFYDDAIEYLWEMLEDEPSAAGIHTAAFLVWRLREYPKSRLIDE